MKRLAVPLLLLGLFSAPAMAGFFGPGGGGLTGITSHVQGDIIYGVDAVNWGTLAKNVTPTRAVCNTGTNNNPDWCQLPIATGISGLGANVATFLATPSSANLAACVTDETGTGALVFSISPTLVTPNIGAATGVSFAPAKVSGQPGTQLYYSDYSTQTTGAGWMGPHSASGMAASYYLQLPETEPTLNQWLCAGTPTGHISTQTWCSLASLAGTTYIKADGTVPLVADWDAGAFAFTGKSFTAKKVASTASQMLLYNNYSTQTTGAGWQGPTSASGMANSYFLILPEPEPAVGQQLRASAPSSHVAETTWAGGQVDAHTAVILTALQTSGGIIYNTGQGPNDVSNTLPTAAAMLSFTALVGEAQGANYWRFARAGSDTICLDGTCGKTYVQIAAPSQGAALKCMTVQMASTGINTSAALAIGGTKTNVYSGAFTYDASGVGYSKAEVAAGTSPGAATTPQNKYGAVAFDIGADGTIDAVQCTNIATGFDSAALAIADLPAAAAGHARMGYVTAMHTDAGGFVWATTELDAAGTTVAYTSSSAYTKPYVWSCHTMTGTWATD